MLTLKSNRSEGVMKVDVYFTIFIKLISQNIKVNKSSASHKVSLQISYYAEKEF